MDLDHLIILAKIKHDRDLTVMQKLQQRQNDLQQAITTLDSGAQSIDTKMRLAQRDGVWRIWALDKTKQLKVNLAQCLAAKEQQKSHSRISAARLEAIKRMHREEEDKIAKQRACKAQDHLITNVILRAGHKS